MDRKLIVWLTTLFVITVTPILSSASVLQGAGNPNSLPPGTKTVDTYIVKPGDTLWALAKQFDTKVADLMSENHIQNPRTLQIGRKLQYTTERLSNGQTTSSQTNNTASQPGQSAASSTKPISVLQNAKVLYCTLTAYTAGPLSTGKQPGDKGYGITATGQKAEQGVTVAVDPDVIPYGTKLYIPGVGYRVAEDTGGAIVGHHVDVFYNQRSQALTFGVKYHQKVYVLPSWFHFPIS